MSKSTLELRGRIVQTGTDHGIPDLRVVVIDQELTAPTMMFRAITDEAGSFCIELSKEEAASLFPPNQAPVWDSVRTLYISVYNGDALLLTTSDQLAMHDIARGVFPTVIQVGVAGTADIEFSVHGRVLQADGSPVGGARIRVERVEAASRTVLVADATETDGTFDLSYAGVDASTASATNTAIVVIVDDDTSGDEIVRTPVIVDPEPRHRVDLLAAEVADYTGQPEYARVLAAFEPWVSASALPNLSSDDLELLVKRSGMPADQVAMAIQAQRIATARGIPAEASYALMRAGLPADVPGQLAQSQPAIRAALQKASDAQMVATTMSNGTPFDVGVLTALYAAEKSSALVSGADSAVRDLMASSGLSQNLTDLFLTRWSEHEGTAPDLWEGLRAGAEFSTQEVDSLEFTTETSAVVDGHLPALSALQADRIVGTISSQSDVAGWDATTWNAFVTTNGAPSTLPGDQQEREAAFAIDSRRRAQARFPSQMVARRFEASPSAAVPGVPEFLDGNQTFEVGRTNVTQFFADNPTATPPGFVAAEMEESVKRVQRVFALTPEHERYDVSRVLLDEGIDSAARIVHMGRASFVDRFSTLFSGSHATLSGENVAMHVYGKAIEKHGFSLAMLAQYGASANSVGIPAVAAYSLDPNAGSGATSLADMFGSMDYCSCSHCSSQFGPAAYLVDLLAALDGAGARDTLDARRPDIAGLDLSCDNTNTPLPYIDLVNELLEQLSAAPATPLQAGNTTWTAEELRLTPEPGPSVAGDPYSAPEAAAFPWTLGKSVRGTELREYMRALGLSRADAMQLFDSEAGVEVLDSDAITAERLGVSAREFQLFAGNTVGEIPQIWGQAAGATDWTGPLALDVGRMLEITGLSFEDLGRALSMRRVRNGVTNSDTLELRFGDPACDIGQAFVNGFDEAAATSLHRLIRASRATGLSLEEVDIVDQTLGGLNGTTMQAVAEIQALQVLESIEVDEACGLWADLDTHDYEGHPSLYTRLFANHEVLVSELGAFPLDTALDETVHFPYLRAALKISDAELRLLIQPLIAAAEAEPGSPTLVVDASVVGFLFARTRLAQLLSMEIDALVIFLELSAVDPFAGPAETGAFIESVDRVRGHGVTAEDADYLCRHRSSVEMADRSIDVDRVLGSLVEALTEVERAATADGTPQETVLAHAEALLESSSVAREAVGMLSAAALSTSSEEEALWQLLVLVDDDPSEFATSLSSATPEERFVQLAPMLRDVRRARGYRESTVAVLAAAMNLDGDLVQLLATDLVLVDSGSTSVLDALADPQLVLTPVAILESHRTAVAQMHKVGNLLSSMGVARRDMTWLFSPTDGASSLSLSELPLAEPSASEAQTYFAGLEALVRWVAILEEHVGSVVGLGSLGELAAEMNWQVEDVTWASSAEWLGLADSDLQDVDVMWQLRRMAAAVRTTNVRAPDLAQWARATPDVSAANTARSALQSNYDRRQWAAVIQPISDRLRGMRRDVLLDYVVERDGFANRDALLAHYLVDVQMGACTLTSRIKLAISAVQLFFQRSIMELEAGVTLAPGIEREWEWRKNYRVWEANRKVFFYPENWATPELRTNKTHLFEQLEATIQRAELTEAAAEKAVVDYVVGLHEVSQLIVLDIHRWSDPATGNLVESVVARTRAAPSEFFYRARVAKGTWSPWEKIESGISGEHAIIKAIQGRVFVVWLDFLDANQKKGADGTSKNRRPILSWSERWQGEWTPKRTIPALREGAPGSSNKRFMLWGGPSNDPLAVYVLFFEQHGGSILQAWKANFDPVLNVMTSAGTAQTTYHTKQSLAIQGAIRGQRYTYGRPPNDDGQSLSDVQLHHFADTEADVDVFRVAQLSRKPPVSLNHQGGMPFAEPRTYVIDFSGGAILGEAVSGASLQVGAGSQSSSDQAQLFNADLKVVDEEEPSALDLDAYQLSETELASAYEFSTAGGSIDPATASASLPASATSPNGFRFESFSHPYTGVLLVEVAAGGAAALFEPRNEKLRRQVLEEEYLFHEDDAPSELDEISYLATENVLSPLPKRSFDFEPGGAYSIYNWELFFHVPLYIANRFRLENRFADADRWYRFVFDPSRTPEDPGEGVERFWNVKPLFQESQSGTLDIVQELFSNGGPDANSDAVQAFKKGVQTWLGNPFDPHAIAAVRPGTYRWVAVKGYLDNLLDWGDALFRRDTIESINEATQLYLLAAELLGQRPRSVQALDTVTQTYNDLDDPSFFGGYSELEGWDPLQGTDPSSPPGSSTFSNTFGAESPVPPFNPVPTSLAAPTAPLPPAAGGVSSFAADLPAPLWWTFCLPPNPELLAYWDRVGDRLFKIRNCRNIEGVERMLALFAPPIDPGLLVNATALEIDLSEAIEGTFAPTPNHRYRVLAARAVDLASDVRALGGALLTAIEKRDGESLSRLRAVHEVSTLERARAVRSESISEAGAQIEALEVSLGNSRERQRYFKHLGEKGLIQAEKDHVSGMASARRSHRTKRSIELGSLLNALLPTVAVGTSNSVGFGSLQLSAFARFNAASYAGDAADSEMGAQGALVSAGHTRRFEDWRYQAASAERETKQIERQIVAAKVRLAIAERELANHDHQTGQSKAIRLFYQDKFSSEELYDWMISEISRLYFMSYKLAFDMAKKAERAMQFELEIDDTFIGAGYWDSLRKGLMAGERLHLDIKRMESQYLDKDKRELELTKRVSLRQVAPGALAQLRQSGECEFEIPELLFDLDHGGHYLRRMRAVRVTIPAVAGPQTSIGTTLTLLRDDLRTEASDDEATVRTTFGGTKRVATSHAREDGGLFELNFRDERYLPFEGAGVASRWSLRLPTAVRQFDYDTISDVEIRIDYTARDGGSLFRQDVEQGLQGALSDALAVASENGMAMVLSAKKDFAVDWERFLRPAEGQASTLMEVPITSDRFPYLLRGASLKVESVQAILVGSGFLEGDADATLSSPSDGELTMPLGPDGRAFEGSFNSAATVDHRPWGLDLGSAVEIDNADEVEDLWVIVRFTATLPTSS